MDPLFVYGQTLEPISIRAVTQAVKGHDAVVCLLGAPLRDRSLIRTKGTRVIVDAMKHVGVRRIVCLSAFGVGNTITRSDPAKFIAKQISSDEYLNDGAWISYEK